MKKRELWLDYLRTYACILVAIGHLFMSFQEASIRDSSLISYIIETIYHFHVYIFFFCSGYLLQKSAQQCTDLKRFVINKLLRCTDFMIVYIIFSGVTYGIKMIFVGDVNSAVEYTFLQTLFQHPINQMWYLYAISVITICTPMLKKQNVTIILALTLILKILVCIPICSEAIPVPLNYLANNQIWYVLGSLWAYKKITLRMNTSVTLAGIFLVINTLAFFTEYTNVWCNTFLTLIGVVASVGICYALTSNRNKMSSPWNMFAKYMFPIYLLHTICAAGIRIVLLRLNITNYWIHLVLGILFSFAIPILCGVIAGRIKILSIFFYPIKTIQKMQKQTQQVN